MNTDYTISGLKLLPLINEFVLYILTQCRYRPLLVEDDNGQWIQTYKKTFPDGTTFQYLIINETLMLQVFDVDDELVNELVVPQKVKIKRRWGYSLNLTRANYKPATGVNYGQ